jgi:hypothetical protein
MGPMVLKAGGTGLTILPSPRRPTAPLRRVDVVLGWDPHPKIDWIGTKNNYGLVSQRINITSVPGPVVGAGLPGLLGAVGALVILARRRRRIALY